MSELKQIAPATYLIEKSGKMKVPCLVIATEKLLSDIDIEKPLIQLKNVSELSGIVGYSIAMPDIHWGYGFPIGGVAAMDIETGVISPGGVGYDINCGVRLALVPIEYDSIKEETKEQLLKTIYEEVPSGVGSYHKNIRGLSDNDYEALVTMGAKWSLERGFGFSRDLDHTESLGKIEGGEISSVSFHAKERGRKQLGSLGSGNHFIEIGKVEKIFKSEIASQWNISLGQTYVLIHSGSRGFGHQICQDTLNSFVKKGYAEGLPDRQLVAAPIQSTDGKNYFSAMAAAANYAFNNRQMMLHLIRDAFKQVLNIPPQEIVQLYDVCHNMAKFEEHMIEGKLKNLCVHRKGATRAFGPGAKELAPIFKKTGQPVLVPGDMGRASYLLAGLGNALTWCSSCHGAGRSRSRTQSFSAWKGKNLLTYMEQVGVKVMAASFGTIAEEMPDAYKDVNEVVSAVDMAKLASIVVKLKPHLVIKG
jgi:tRNA-splicing ligase RtcB (3'-phosphate/5'-hydroxy nucleic acid ligase)